MTSTESTTLTSLQPASTDYVTSAAKAALGMVPFAGSLLAELAGCIIPNQRIDRLSKFAVELEGRLSRLDQTHVRAQLADEHFTDLMEEGVRQASRSVSDERRQYLAGLLANGISSEASSYAESKHLLRILGELNDIEVIWLRFYVEPTFGGDAEFREKHRDVLDPVRAHLGSDPETLDKDALQKSYKEHLCSLGLLRHRYETDSKTKQPVFDNFTGGLKVRGYDITPLGRLLLRSIDLWSESRA
jgi:hypothetical protein